MILAALDLENYKQYAGAHQIEFPAQGMIAITGPNGAGKTTLFEAIEWCLYGSLAVPRASIPPHGGIGRTTVRVTLEDPQDGRRYVVQRELRSSSSRAEVYAEDQPGQSLVQGPREVTDYVTKRLIGLPHAAFVSTFFTRQKELTFFGDLMPTDRRVEVARLLGFQTIREAQNDLAAERTQARQTAASLRAQYERESGDRDFAVEVAAGELLVDEARAAEDVATHSAKDAEIQADQSREALEHWRGIQERDAAFDRELVRLAGESATTEANHGAAESTLRRLARRAEDRASLFPQAETASSLAREVSALDEQRGRADGQRALEDARRGGTERIALVAGRLTRLVAEHAETASGLLEWDWIENDNARPEDGAARLQRAAAALDPDASRERVERLRHVLTCSRNADAASGSLAKFRKLHEKLTSELEALLASGDPQLELAAAEKAELQARDAERAARQARAAARITREDHERIARDLRELADGAQCPMCRQELSRADAERIASVLDVEVQRLHGAEAAAVKAVADADAGIERAKRALAAANDRQGKRSVLDGRLADGAAQIGGAETTYRECQNELKTAYAGAAVTTPPGEPEIQAVRQMADRMQRIAGLAPLLEQLGSQGADARAATEEAERGIAELGPVNYDAEAHRSAQTALAAARDAQAQIGQIDKELSARGEYETQRDTASARLFDLRGQLEIVAAERSALGFDPAALASTLASEAAARAAAHAARIALNEIRTTLQQAQARLHRVIEDRDRLRQLAEESDRQGREADELERMVREFVEFDRFVADRVGPLLAETTERLLGQVTEGKYDHVRFDENYGIAVYDGDEAFDLTGFSGGERDVVSLCARLAMSELVGSAAVRPPRFLVLDEVFGSLDSERRAQLLGALGALASSGRFQQVFIISHIDDVQQSHVMDEAWTIEERDGASHVIRPEPSLAALG